MPTDARRPEEDRRAETADGLEPQFRLAFDVAGHVIFRSLGVPIMAFSGLIAFFILAGPTPWERVRLVSCVLEANPADLTSVTIRPPSESWYASKKLLSAEVEVVDPASLERLCDALNHAESWSPNHPEPVWVCELVLNKKAETCRCLVQQTTNNGVLVELDSESDGGATWNLGSFRSDSLGPVLESLAVR